MVSQSTNQPNGIDRQRGPCLSDWFQHFNNFSCSAFFVVFFFFFSSCTWKLSRKKITDPNIEEIEFEQIEIEPVVIIYTEYHEISNWFWYNRFVDLLTALPLSIGRVVPSPHSTQSGKKCFFLFSLSRSRHEILLKILNFCLPIIMWLIVTFSHAHVLSIFWLVLGWINVLNIWVKIVFVFIFIKCVDFYIFVDCFM